MIHFLSPGFLYGLLLISIPVIIHLFNFRRFKKVMFTNVRFLKELKQETTSKSKLKHLLVLCARILAVAFLVFAFARPILPAGKTNNRNESGGISVYVDNSFTMEANRPDGTLLEVAKKKAREIVNAYPSSQRFQLLTAEFDPVHQRLMNREDFLDMLDQVHISSSSRTLNDIIKRQHEALLKGNAGNGPQYIISDFQSNMSAGKIESDTTEQINLVPVQAPVADNIYIDSCWLGVPAVQLNQPTEFSIRIVNESDREAENIPVKIRIDGQVRAVTSVKLEPRQSVVTVVNFTISNAGWHRGEASINDHPVTFDDSWFFSFEVKDAVSVLAINGASQSPYIQALFGSNVFVKLTNSSYTQVDYSTLQQQQLVILNEPPSIASGLADELKKYIYSGGHLILFPDSVPDIESYNSFLSLAGADAFSGINHNADKVVSLDKNNELFADVFQDEKNRDASIDYPTVQKHFDIVSTSGSSRQVLMKLQGGGPFLSQYNSGKGSLYIFTSPLSPGYTNLAHHAVFVPTLYKMAILSMKGHDLSYTIGRNTTLQLKGNVLVTEENFKLISDADKNEAIPQHRVTSSGIDISFNNIISTAGHYELMSGGNTVSVLSFNYDRQESDMNMLTADQIKSLMSENRIENYSTFGNDIPDLTLKLKQLTEGIYLWKYCIILVLLFLLAETLLLRFWKT